MNILPILALALTLPLAAEATEGAKPNVIFILADDLGIGNVGCYGSDHYKTPKSTSSPRRACASRSASPRRSAGHRARSS